MDFGKILKQGKRRFETKHRKYKWGECDDCGYRKQIFTYIDNEGQDWQLCDTCTDNFVKEEEEE